MEDRINIDGVWYVRETSTSSIQYKDKTLDYTDVVTFEGAIYETDLYCFEATMIKREDGTLYPDVAMKVTRKDGDRDDWVEESIDNPKWFIALFNGDSENLKEARKMWCIEGISQLRSFLIYLETLGWIDLTKK